MLNSPAMRISKAWIAATTLGLLLCACRGNSPEQQTSQTSSETTPAPAAAAELPAPVAATPIVVGSSRMVGYVFDDKNKNGTLDDSEGRLPSQVVLITNPSATKRIQDLTTDAMGVFRVDGLGDGEYRVSVQIPAGYQRTNDDSFSLKIAKGQPVPEVHFGITKR